MAESVSCALSLLVNGNLRRRLLLLAAIGIYGWLPTQWLNESRRSVFAWRSAPQSRVIGLIVGQGSRLAAAGIALGIAGALGLTRFLEKMLFGITTSDAATFIAAPLVLGVVAIVASLIPASKAVRIDPITALRQD